MEPELERALPKKGINYDFVVKEKYC